MKIETIETESQKRNRTNNEYKVAMTCEMVRGKKTKSTI